MEKEVVSPRCPRCPRSPRTEVLTTGTDTAEAARTSWTGLGVGVHPGRAPRAPVFHPDCPWDPALCLLPGKRSPASTL